MIRHRSTRTARCVSRRAVAAVAALAWIGACGGEAEAPAEAPATNTSNLTRSLLAEPPERPDGEVVDIEALGYDEGSEDATIRIVEFSDFGCGYCRKFHEESYPVIHEEYIATGKVLWKYVPFVIGMFPNGDEAGLAGECAADQGRFSEMRDLLFHEQPEWKSSDDAMPHLLQYGEDLGLDGEEYASCIEEQRPGPRLAVSIRAARALGIRGTPTFFINGYPVQGALPTQLFRDIFEAELEAQQSGETESPTGQGQPGS